MESNEKLQQDVQDAIKWEPLLHAAEIGVTAKNGIVSLTGVVDSYLKKMEAEDAAKRVKGVKALVENIEVKFPNIWTQTDEEVAEKILTAFKSNVLIPSGGDIKVKVENGWVSLEGELSWHYQKQAVQNSLHYLAGVRGITNNIRIKSESHNHPEKKGIEKALQRSSIDDSNISVSVLGTTATLSGSVHSWYQHQEASRIAWNTPGIWHVVNQLTIAA
ncbi:MAG: BON domain-containing protein [Candidatus Kapaibacterium sp.]